MTTRGILIGKAFAATALGGLLFVTAAATAAQPPARGTSLEFRCNLPGTGAFVQQYRIDQVNGSNITVSVTDHRGNHSYSKPFYLGGTTLFRESRNDGVDANMSGDLDDFDGLANLQTGWRQTGWVTERRDNNQPDLRWHYTVTVSGRERIFNEALGESDVVVIEEERWADLYSSRMYSHVSSDLGFPVFWQYSDSNGVELRCELAALSQPKAPATASRPGGQTDTARPPRRSTQAAAISAPTLSQKLAVLDDLLDRGLITKTEHQTKAAELQDLEQTNADRIFASLEALNRSFRQKRISAEDFIRRRTQVLAKVNARNMTKSEALALAKSLVDERLISQVEYTRKRIELTETN